MLALGDNALQALGDFLVVRDPLVPADVVIAISGDGEERVRTAAALVAQGYGRRLLVSGGPILGPGSAAEMFEQARRFFPGAIPILIDDRATSTAENATGSAAVMRANGLRTAILVTSPYHMRRSIMLYRRVFHPAGMEVRAFPVPDSFFRVERWWTRPGERRVVLREYAKLLAAVVGIH